MSALDTLLDRLAADRRPATDGAARTPDGAGGLLDVKVPALARFADGADAFGGDADFLGGDADFLGGDAAAPDHQPSRPLEPGVPATLPTLTDAMGAAVPALGDDAGQDAAAAALDAAVAALDARTVVGAGAFADVDALGPRGARALLAWLGGAARRQGQADDGGDGTLRGGAHGGVGRLLCRALASADERLVVEALQIIEALELRALQVAVAELFVVRAGQLDHATVEAALLTLERVGDGRCVRTMEAALAEHQDALTSHQAWRARRIVQRIRRFWRK